jgi:3-isopropylmalate dehydratase small subunit
MNLPKSRLDPLLQAAQQRVQASFRDTVHACVEALAGSAHVPLPGLSRDALSTAQIELDRKQSAVTMAFNEALADAVTAEVRRRRMAVGEAGQTVASSWESLSLVDDDEMERQTLAERMGQTMRQGCGNELALLDAYLSGMLNPSDRPENDRNPFRPEVLTKCMLGAVYTVSSDVPVRRLLSVQFEHEMGSSVVELYTLIAEDFKAAGVEPAVGGMVRTTAAPASRSDDSTRGGFDPAAAQGHRPGASGAAGSIPGRDGGSPAAGAAGGGTPIGDVDHNVMNLLRRLAATSAAHGEPVMRGGEQSGFGLNTATAVGAMPLTNVIAAHREELRGATSSALDHMVIDVVGSLFDQILADPKVPPHMARHIARLQLPVLRAAMGDKTFFSSRKHPVRRFVNRIASLSVAFEDFGAESAREFLALVQALVDEIVAGDFDQVEIYEDKLQRLETFIAEQARVDVEQKGDMGSMLDQREVDLLQHQRYTQQMHAALTPVPMDDFLRTFLTQVWSQAIVHAHRMHGESAPATHRMRAVGRELVLSVQPKTTPEERKQFLGQLPTLMKGLTEGLAMIGWPDSAKKAFLGQLLPAHSESLKSTKALSHLDHNLLVKQLDMIMATPVPKPGEVPVPGAPMANVEEAIAPVFTDDELRRVGLLRENAVDWQGDVDIDLSADAEVKAVDLDIAGLPTGSDTLEPVQGAALADHLQIGYSYRMHYERAWHKVRLSHVSPGRTFFVFTHGHDHAEAISMTSRMVKRLCESGRLRAYENAQLLERATARARQQLANVTRSGATLM